MLKSSIMGESLVVISIWFIIKLSELNAILLKSLYQMVEDSVLSLSYNLSTSLAPSINGLSPEIVFIIKHTQTHIYMYFYTNKVNIKELTISNFGLPLTLISSNSGIHFQSL